MRGLGEATGHVLITSKPVVKKCADQFDNVDIGPLVVAADIIGVIGFAVSDDEVDAAIMVIHVEPVPDLFAIAVDGQRLAVQAVGNNKGNKLFRELVRAVVVGAVANGGV